MQFIKAFDYTDDIDIGFEPKMLRELILMQAGSVIKKKPNWVKKILDPEISGKWR